MNSSGGFFICMNGVTTPIGPTDEHDWARHESLIRADYGRCHPGDTFDDLKRRARFSKEDQGLLQDWMSLAARRAAEQHVAQTAIVSRVAA